MYILHNGNIYTQIPDLPTAEAIAIEGPYIIAVGDNQHILQAGKPGAQIIDLKGKTVLPGLTDSHLHLEQYAFSLLKINCETDSLQECLDRVSQRVKQSPPGTWILGHGWNQNNWEGGFGTVEDLDRIAPENPVYLTAKSLHAAWANSTALRMAGINAQTPDPPDGIIARNDRGEPNGIVFESAMNLLDNIIPPPTTQETVSAIKNAQKSLWQMGITGVHDFDGISCFMALQILNHAKELKLRVIKGIPKTSLENAVKMGIRTGFGSDMLKFGPLKLFADGAMGPQTAALLAPFENEENYCGELFLTENDLFEIGKYAVSNGIHLAVHAIGDRANREILNGYQRIRQFEVEHGLEKGRHRIEHVQILSPEDHNRLHEYGIIASVQPIHATSDMEISDRYLGDRAKNAYVFKSLRDHGTVLAFGSDAPVESPNPFFGIHAAVTRKRTNGDPGGEGWHPEQKISVKEAVSAYTLAPAFSSGMEDRVGKLCPGFYADLIVLEQNLFTIPADAIHLIKPQATMVNGEWVWSSN